MFPVKILIEMNKLGMKNLLKTCWHDKSQVATVDNVSCRRQFKRESFWAVALIKIHDYLIILSGLISLIFFINSPWFRLSGRRRSETRSLCGVTWWTVKVWNASLVSFQLFSHRTNDWFTFLFYCSCACHPIDLRVSVCSVWYFRLSGVWVFFFFFQPVLGVDYLTDAAAVVPA
jgi:hypothetical protein